jgi:endonuclease/exonuclease/phosphatase (EEP) superfamily protein YafD
MVPSIDHIFTRGTTAARSEVLRCRGSDHLPIYAEVELDE